MPLLIVVVVATAATAPTRRARSLSAPPARPGGASIRTYSVPEATDRSVVVTSVPAHGVVADRMEVRTADGAVVARWRPRSGDTVVCADCRPVVVARGTRWYAADLNGLEPRAGHHGVAVAAGDAATGAPIVVQLDRSRADITAGTGAAAAATVAYEPNPTYQTTAVRLPPFAARQADGGWLTVQPQHDPLQPSGVVLQVARPGRPATSRSVVTPASPAWFACFGQGGALGVITADRAILLPRGLRGPVEVLPIPAQGFSSCAADPGGVDVWWQEVVGAGSVEVVRVTQAGTSWRRTATLTEQAGVTTYLDVRHLALVALPVIGVARVIDLGSGRVREGRSVAAARLFPTVDGTWWQLGYDGRTTVVPSPADAA